MAQRPFREIEEKREKEKRQKQTALLKRIPIYDVAVEPPAGELS